MNAIRNSSTWVIFALILTLTVSGCKSKKKAMEAQAAEKARIEQEAATRKQKEEQLKKEEELKRKEAEENARREAAQKEAAANAAGTPSAKLSKYLEAIISASSVTAANSSINEALTLFASPQTPVLIVISEENGQKDYDKPTTIQDYLHYLKDQKKSTTKISALEVDDAGKIKALELRKNL